MKKMKFIVQPHAQKIETTVMGDSKPTFVFSQGPLRHIDIYWAIHEAVFCDCCVSGLSEDEAKRYAHCYAVKMTHTTYLSQFNG